jgi:hypothetical protein
MEEQAAVPQVRPEPQLDTSVRWHVMPDPGAHQPLNLVG